MKKSPHIIIIILACIIGISVSAQFALLPPAGMTPASKLYAFEKLFESVGTFFTFGREKKIARYITLAEERLSEAVELSYNDINLVLPAVQDFQQTFARAVELADRANSAPFKELILASVAKHFAVFEEIYELVREDTRAGIEPVYDEDRNIQKRLLFEVAGKDQLTAAELGFASIRERITKLKSEIELGRQYETNLITSHIKNLFDVLAATSLDKDTASKEFLSVLSNDITRALESLDDIERSPKRPSGEAESILRDLKSKFISVQIDFSRNMIPVDAKFVVAVLDKAMQSRVGAIDRLSLSQTDAALSFLAEYERYLLFAREVETRAGRFIIEREQNRTIGSDIEKMLLRHKTQLQQKKRSLSVEAQSEIDRITALIK